MTIHQPGMFNIEAWDGARWHGAMNRAERQDAIETAHRWSAEEGRRHRVFDLGGQVIYDSEAAVETPFSLDRQQYHAMEAALAAECNCQRFSQAALFYGHEVDGDEHAREARSALAEWDGIRSACARELGRIAQLKHPST